MQWKKKEYNFTTQWVLKATITEVWSIMTASEQWPEWWKGVISVTELAKGDEKGLGSIRRYTLTSPMYYELSFDLLLTERKEFQLLEGKVSGKLEGTGIWTFSQRNDICYITCYWKVKTNVRWMNVLAPLLAPLFRYNHKIVMISGAKGLARKLEALLIAYE